MNKYIPWWQPQITQYDYKYVQNVLESGYINEGNVTTQFEKKIARLLNVRYAVAVSSGTAALFLALKSLGVGLGDEIILPDVTFIATANAISLTGAKPILVDVDPKTLLIDPQSIKKAITKRTRAIIPVHISGHASNMVEIIKISQEYHLPIIEDSCEAFLSAYKGRYLGTWGILGCFSFSPHKSITTGQGGLVVTNSKKLYDHVRELKDQGRSKPGTGGDDIHSSIGFNFKLTNIQSAIGLGQLRVLQKRQRRQKEIYSLYSQHLKNVDGIRILPFDIDGGEIPLWTDALVDQRDKLVDYLSKYNIDCRKFWFPIHTQTPYRLSDKRFPDSLHVSLHAVWLPSAFSLENEDILKVCHLIKKFLSK